MSSPHLKAAILVISTTASKDPSTDSSGGILKDVFATEGGGKWEVVETKIVGDNMLEIQRTITNWADGDEVPNLIITTGGTGFSVHDHTPEVGAHLFKTVQKAKQHFQAVTPLLHKHAPGLVHGMLAASLAVTPC
jgi:gephyrin